MATQRMTIEQRASAIAHAFDTLAEHSSDPLGDFCLGELPGDLPEGTAELLGQLRAVRGKHSGVSEDSPETLAVDTSGNLFVVGYDDNAGGHGMCTVYNPSEDMLG